MSRRSLLPPLALLLIGVVACSSVPGSAAPSGPTAAPTPTIPSSTTTPTAAPSATPVLTEAPSPTGVPVSPSPSPTPSRAPMATPAVTPTPSPTQVDTMIVRAYFFLDDAVDGAPAIVPVLRTVPATTAAARAAMLELLAGPTATERAAVPAITTLIPDGVEVLGVVVVGRTATVDLSSDFAAGGGSFGMRGRLAQVTWTLTQFASVDRVAFELDGEPVTVFSSEGIMLDEPLTRASYRDELLPPIFIDRPAWGAALLTPGHVTGVANVFEAQFRVALLDGSGDVLIERAVTASCGSGCWGRFEVALEYEIATAQWGTLRVWDPSEGDGGPEGLRDYPIYLRPARH